jgi:ATP-dependent protease ClpP protease subunit
MFQFYQFKTSKFDKLDHILKSSTNIITISINNINKYNYFDYQKNHIIRNIKFNSTIIIYINSYGGFFWETIKFIKFLINLRISHKIKIITAAQKNCASAATIIHSIGDIKIICRNTTYMIHNTRYFNLRTNKIKIYTNYKKYYKSNSFKKMIFIYFESSNITERELKNKLKNDYIFNQKEIIDTGFCDIIFNDIDVFYNYFIKYKNKLSYQ